VTYSSVVTTKLMIESFTSTPAGLDRREMETVCAVKLNMGYPLVPTDLCALAQANADELLLHEEDGPLTDSESTQLQGWRGIVNRTSTGSETIEFLCYITSTRRSKAISEAINATAQTSDVRVHRQIRWRYWLNSRGLDIYTLFSSLIGSGMYQLEGEDVQV